MVDRLSTLAAVVFLSLMVAVQVSGAEAVIRPIGYSPQEARDRDLETQRAMPLRVVGVGQPAYLESLHQGTYSWSLSAPEGSSTTLSSTTERQVYLIPDMEGSYVVTLYYTDSAGLASTDELTISGAAYGGVESITGATSAPSCGDCHTEKKTTWEITGHANMLQQGLDGTASLDYEESCLQCHTVGYDTLAVNEGFDDRAAEEGWTFPDSLYEGLYDEFAAGYPRTAQLANIQCESCHGPGSRHMGQGPIGLSYDYGVCAYCHDEQEPSQCGCWINETYYITEQWKHSRHGEMFGPEEDFNRAGNDCVPCHTVEGFFEINVRGNPESTAPYRSLHGITCTLCHDPHDAAGEHQLRIVEDRLSTDQSGAARYKTEGTTASACDVCHHLLPDTDAPGSMPHHSHQTDVLNNQAGYRYPGEEYPADNIHGLAVQGRCAGCHMAYAPDEKRKYVGAHTFAMFAGAAPDNGGPAENLYLTEACICCHGSIGEDFDYHAVQTRVSSLLDNIKARLVLFQDESPAELRGKPRYSTSDVEAGTITQAQMNAAYNWYIFSRDGSRGVHNPALTLAILEHALVDLGGPTAAQWCDFNRDGNMNIVDVIALLLFQRGFAGDPELKTDFNQDGVAGITDAIAMILAMRDGTCPEAPALLLSSTGEQGYLKVAALKNLSRSEIEYLEQMMALMGLTEEEEAAFRTALYGTEEAASLPKTFALDQNSPNPFNPATTISYSVPEGNSVHVRLDIFDISGRLVRSLVDADRDAGTYHVLWDGTDNNGRHLASGVYLYRIQADQFAETRKMVLLK